MVPCTFAILAIDIKAHPSFRPQPRNFKKKKKFNCITHNPILHFKYVVELVPFREVGALKLDKGQRIGNMGLPLVWFHSTGYCLTDQVPCAFSGVNVLGLFSCMQNKPL